MNVKITLYDGQIDKMAYDKSLDAFHQGPAANKYQTKMTNEEFDVFLKENNLITYRNHLKRYQDGVVCGEFTLS